MMNADIYEPGGIALGFHVEKGETLLPLNKEEGQANLYLKTDGGFCISSEAKEKALICTTANSSSKVKQFKAGKPGAEIRLTQQSEPILLNNGSIHPVFKRDSKYLFTLNLR